MTKKEKQIQIALGTYLPNKWKKYLDFKDKGYKLYTEGRKLISEGDKLYIKGRKDKGCNLYAEGHKLCTKGNELYDKATSSYIKTVIEVYGENVTINWKDGSVIKND